MAFKFQNQVVYERLRLFSKDVFIFTGRLPNYERHGLIHQLRHLATDLLENYAATSVRSAPGNPIDSCVTTVAKIAALIDFCAQLDYTDPTTRDKWLLSCDEVTKRLYETRKTLDK
jgi:hypothetical protein